MAQVTVERDGRVLILTLNRPKRKNAMTLTMFALLADAWKELSEDPALSCAVLTGAEGNFSSGMDLRAMAGDVDPDGAIDEQARLKEEPGFIYRGLLKTYRPTKPIIAAVEGVSIAGGTEILQGTDIRVAARAHASASPRRAGRCTRWVVPRCACNGKSRTPSPRTSC